MKVTAGKNTDYIFIAETDPAQASFANSNIQIDAEILLIRTSNGKTCSFAGKSVRKVVFFGETLLEQNKSAMDLCLDLK
ncbi:MAG: hypothetical protein ACYS91_06895 [Planctomycetota bacterium]